MPARAENFHLRNDGFPDVFSQVVRRLFGSDPLAVVFSGRNLRKQTFDGANGSFPIETICSGPDRAENHGRRPEASGGVTHREQNGPGSRRRDSLWCPSAR